MDAYRKCIELDPGHHACRHNLALHLSQLWQNEEAARHYEELVRRGTTNPTSFQNLAFAYLMMGDTAKALETVEAFAKRNPENGSGHTNLAEILMAAGRYDEARPALARADAEAMAQFEKIATSGHEHGRQPLHYVRSSYHLGRLYEQAGNTASAREAHRRFVGYWQNGDLDRERVTEAGRKLAALR